MNGKCITYYSYDKYNITFNAIQGYRDLFSDDSEIRKQITARPSTPDLINFRIEEFEVIGSYQINVFQRSKCRFRVQWIEGRHIRFQFDTDLLGLLIFMDSRILPNGLKREIEEKGSPLWVTEKVYQAVAENSTDPIDELVKAKIDLAMPIGEDITLIDIAARNIDIIVDLVVYMLDHGAQPTIHTLENILYHFYDEATIRRVLKTVQPTPICLYYAVKGDYYRVSKMIVHRGISVNQIVNIKGKKMRIAEFIRQMINHSDKNWRINPRFNKLLNQY